MISENHVQYACDAHQMKGIEERNTDMKLKLTHMPPGGRNRPFSNMAAVNLLHDHLCHTLNGQFATMNF